ncbi:hypothetical protein FWF48_03440 [Candidatus Saccharibacteria bacterium]|nr:hypothetical protein [Candidatus Saccharibacteria bacterium]
MLLISLFSWWYTGGLKVRARGLLAALTRTLDLFSIGLLLKTLFAPFRQISAAQSATAPIDVKFRMFFDRTFSRLIGAVMRMIVIVAGLLTILVQTIISIFMIVLHLVLPLLPVVGIVMLIFGWVPKWPI